MSRDPAWMLATIPTAGERAIRAPPSKLVQDRARCRESRRARQGREVVMKSGGAGLGKFYLLTFWWRAWNNCSHALWIDVEYQEGKRHVARVPPLMDKAERFINQGAGSRGRDHYRARRDNRLSLLRVLARLKFWKPGRERLRPRRIFRRVDVEERIDRLGGPIGDGDAVACGPGFDLAQAFSDGGYGGYGYGIIAPRGSGSCNSHGRQLKLPGSAKVARNAVGHDGGLYARA